MEKYNINLGFHYMKSRLQKFYLDKEYKEKKLRFEVIKIDKNNNQKNLEDLINIDKIYFSVNYPGLLIGTGTTIEYTPFNKEKKIIILKQVYLLIIQLVFHIFQEVV